MMRLWQHKRSGLIMIQDTEKHMDMSQVIPDFYEEWTVMS